MKKHRIKTTMVIALAVLLGLSSVGGDLMARPSGGSSSRSSFSSSRSSSSRSSGGFGSSKSTQTKSVQKTDSTKPSAVASSVKTAPVKSPDTIKAEKAQSLQNAKDIKAANDKKSADIAISKINTKTPEYSKTDKMLQQNIGKSGKKFNSRSEAQADLTAKMATKTYTYKDTGTALANRPDYVPATRSVGGVTYNTTYVNGQYGYMNPAGMFMAYMAADMLINDSMLHSYGYRPSGVGISGFGILMSMLGFIVTVAILVAIVKSID